MKGGRGTFFADEEGPGARVGPGDFARDTLPGTTGIESVVPGVILRFFDGAADRNPPFHREYLGLLEGVGKVVFVEYGVV